MPWYKTGTVSIVSGETSITGTGTRFVTNSRVGDGFRAPDGEWYEITNFASETALGIYPAYQGSTVTNSSNYMIAPLQGYNKDTADRLRTITDGIADITEDVTTVATLAAETRVDADRAVVASDSAQTSATTATNAQNATQSLADQVTQDKVETLTARDQAVAASQAAAQGFVDRGNVDLSGGSYPSIPSTSSFWRVSVAGTVSGTEYSVGDLLIYSSVSSAFYKAGGSSGTGGVTSVNTRTGDVVLTKADVALGNVDNTSDANKPVSTATQAALGNKVDKVTGKQLSTEDFTSVLKTKLDGIASGATLNQTDAYLLNRTNHTGTQTASTVSDFANAVLATEITGLTSGSNTPIVSSDLILAALSKLQAQVTARALRGDNNDITSLRALTVDGFERLRQGIAPMVGATTSTDSTKGLVPVASVADRLKVLSGAGTWVALPSGAAWGDITGSLANQADLIAALGGKLNNSDIAFTYLYPSGTSAAPPTIAANTRIAVANPYPASPIIVVVEVFLASTWGEAGWDGNSGTGSSAFGTKAGQVMPTDQIIVQSGATGVSLSGAGNGSLVGAVGTVTSAPYRLKVFKFKGSLTP